MNTKTLGLPPGSRGLPFLGETLVFARGPFEFFESRFARHGPVFQTSLLGRRTAAITTRDALEVFIDPERCMRAESMPGPVYEMFAGESVPTLDGHIHRNRKEAVMAAFSEEAVQSYLPEQQEAIERMLSRCASAGEMVFLPELKRLAFEMICLNVMGIGDAETLDRLIRDYQQTIHGFTALPIKLPFTTFGKALKARDRALGTLRIAVEAHRKGSYDDGLSHVLTHRTADGSAIADDEAVRELHHIVLAGYIVFAELASLLIELKRHPDVLSRLRTEIDAAPARPLTAQGLADLPFLSRVVMEVKRLTPIVPAIFAVAKRDFEFKGYKVPKGWTVCWVPRGSLLDPATYTDPNRFDPDRFSPERAEHKKHPHAYVPQGAGDYFTHHKCAGIRFTDQLMQAFTLLAVRGYDWELPEQDLGLNMKAIPPEQKDGLRVRFRPRA